MSGSQSKESSPDYGSEQQTASSPASSRSSCSTGTSVLTGGQRDNNNVQMKRNLSLWNGVTIIVGIIVGSGIFVSPKGVMKEIKSVGASLIVWIACGILSTIGAICYAELGTAIPESGGDYAYIKRSFGPLPAFLFLYVALFIIMPAGNAVAALTFANYIVQPLTACPPESITHIVALVAATAVCEYTISFLMSFLPVPKQKNSYSISLSGKSLICASFFCERKLLFFAAVSGCSLNVCYFT